MQGAVPVILAFILPCSLAGHGARWRYGDTVYGPHYTAYGPKDWSHVSRHCVENAQSPINIDTVNRKNFQRFTYLRGFRFNVGNRWKSLRGILFNNGHAPTIKIVAGSAILSGGPWGSAHYKLEQLHFHFGCASSWKGSEHTVDGMPYSGELHLVFYNIRYVDFNTAADKPDGLTVIAVFLEENHLHASSPELWKIANGMRKLTREDDDNVKISLNLYLYSLVPQLTDLSRTSFFSYKGSLTTPPCYQSVNWIVLNQFIPASKEVMDAMRSFQDHEGRPMCNDYRPTQPLNGRIITGYMG